MLPKGALAVPPKGVLDRKIYPVEEEQAGRARGASQGSTHGALVPPKGALWCLPREHSRCLPREHSRCLPREHSIGNFSGGRKTSGEHSRCCPMTILADHRDTLRIRRSFTTRTSNCREKLGGIQKCACEDFTSPN